MEKLIEQKCFFQKKSWKNRSLQFFLNQSDELEVGPSDLPGPLPGNADNGWNPMDATQRMESPKNDTTNVFFCFYSKKMNENTHVFRENIF